METRHKFETENVFKLILGYGLPCASSLLINALYNIVDQIFIGQSIGYLGNAATNTAFPITAFLIASTVLVTDGVSAFYSAMLGAKKFDIAKKAVGNTIIILAVMSIIFFTFSITFTEQLVRLFGATDAVLPYALDYTRIITFGFPALMLSIGCNSFARSDGSPLYSMFAILLGAVINLILDPIFIFGFGMGIKGAAYATIIGQYAGLIMGLMYLKRFKNIKFSWKLLKFDFNVAKKIVSIGSSSFVMEISYVIIIAVCNRLLVHYGAMSKYGSEIPLAAMGIIFKIFQILSAIILGLSLGAQPVVGYNFGAKNYNRVKELFKGIVLISLIITGVAFIGFMFFPDKIMLLFGSESQAYMEFSVIAFRLYLPLCFATGFYFPATILFQAMGQTIKATFLALCKQILTFIPSAIILGSIFGLYGVLISGAISDFTSVILASFMIYFELRKLTKLQTQKLTQ